MYVGDDGIRRVLPDESFLAWTHQILIPGSLVDAPDVRCSNRGEVLHTRREAVDDRERVRRHLDHGAGVGAAPGKSRPDDRYVRRGDCDGGLDDTWPGRDEVEGEVGEGANVAACEEGEEDDAELLALGRGRHRSLQSCACLPRMRLRGVAGWSRSNLCLNKPMDGATE